MDLWCGGLESPSGEDEVFFDALLGGIGEVVEEVDAGVAFELGDAECVFAHVGGGAGLAVVFVFEPKGDAAIYAVFDLEERHEVVRRYGYAIAGDVFENTGGAIDGAALHDIERVGKGSAATEILHQVFEGRPVALVEVGELGAHVREIEGLIVGFAREESIGRGDEMPVIIAVERDVGGQGFVPRKEGIGGILGLFGVGLAAYLLGTGVGVETEGDPARMKEGGIVGDGIVENGVAAGGSGRHTVDEEALGGVAGEQRHLDAQGGQPIGFAHFSGCDVRCGVGRGGRRGRGARIAPVDLGFLLLVAGHERERQAEEGEKKSVHVLCL